MTNRVGQQLGNYRLLRVLGQGAFAAVYLGEHQYLERSAAIKVLQVQIESSARQESFRREARTIAQLDHPSIISVHDFGISDQVPYLVMDYMPHGTLRQRFPKGSLLLASADPHLRQTDRFGLRLCASAARDPSGHQTR